MKKKRVLLIIASVIVCIGLGLVENKVQAEDKHIVSRGNLVFQNDQAVLYSEDIYYLQNELNNLFNEIK